MNHIQRKQLVELLNKPKCYSDSLKEWFSKENVTFKKEDSKLLEFVDTTQQSVLFGQKLHILFQLAPELDYMYYFNNEDCLLSKIIKSKQYKIIDEIIKAPADKHGQFITKKELSITDSMHNNILHVFMKNVDSPHEFYMSLGNIIEILKLVTDKDEISLQKDKNGKDFIDYIFENTNRFFGDVLYSSPICSNVSLVIHELLNALEKKEYTNIDEFIKISSQIDDSTSSGIYSSGLKEIFLEMKSQQEKKEILENMSKETDIDKKNIKRI